MPDRDVGAVVILDSNGNIVNFTSSGGTSMTDDAAFTPASSSVTPAGFVFDDVATDSVDEGDVGAARMTADRIQMMGGNIASSATDSGNPVKVGARYNSTKPTLTDGQRGDMQLDTRGNLTVNLLPTNSGSSISDATNGLFVNVKAWNGTAPVTGSGTATGALRVELPTNGTGVLATVGAVTAITNALPAGTNAIGKLAANSGVDIGDVDVTSIAAGTNLIGDVGIQPRTSNGLTTFMASGSDGSSILVATAQVIKASAGQLYGYYAFNPEAATTFVHFYNTAAASVTVGTTNPLFTLAIPAGAAANLMNPLGITFSNAGWSCAATTTAGGNTAPATGVSLVAWYA